MASVQLSGYLLMGSSRDLWVFPRRSARGVDSPLPELAGACFRTSSWSMGTPVLALLPPDPVFPLVSLKLLEVPAARTRGSGDGGRLFPCRIASRGTFGSNFSRPSRALSWRCS